MKTGRPKIKVPIEGLDIVLDLISVTLLILLITYAVISYSELPDTIPSHFNAKGEVDGYSEKSMIWSLPAISTVLFGQFLYKKHKSIELFAVIASGIM